MNKLMKAAAITGRGGPEVLQVIDAPVPPLEARQALIRVRAVGLNWLDVLARTEDFGLKFPHIGGSDVSGVVEAVGPNSTLTVGAEVLVNPGYPCNQCEQCRTGNRECQFVRILGLHSPGGYGQYLAVPDAQVFQKPRGVSFEQAAAFPLDFLTAWRMLVTRGRLVPGERVFIWGASGALGVAAIQLSRHLGAHVIAAVGSAKYADAVRQLGAHTVINYRTENVLKAIQSATADQGVDLVFESIGKETMQRSLQVVKAGGRVVICGTRSGDLSEVDFSDLYYRQISIVGSRMGTHTDFKQVYSLLVNGPLDVHVGRTMPLRQISEAHRALESRDFVGKIVLTHEVG